MKKTCRIIASFMKDKMFKVVSIAGLVIAVISLFKIASLKNEIYNLESKMNNISEQNSHLETEILSSVNTTLEEYNNDLAKATYEYEDYKFDEDNINVKAHVQVVPKTYNPEKTIAYLVGSDGQEFPLEYADGKYVGEICVSVFDKLSIDYVVLDTDGTLSTQTLNWLVAPEDVVFPAIDVIYSGEIQLDGKDHNKVLFDPAIQVIINEIYTGNPIKFKGADVVVQKGKHEIDRIPFVVDNYDKVVNLSMMNNQKTYDIKKGETLGFFIEIKEDNFTFKRLIDTVTVNDKGERILNDELSEYQFTQNIVVKYDNKILYDISDEILE